MPAALCSITRIVQGDDITLLYTNDALYRSRQDLYGLRPVFIKMYKAVLKTIYIAVQKL